MISERKTNLAVLIILAILFGPIILFGLKQCAEGCPPGQVLARGAVGFVCVQGASK